jgi:hypothetical protein
MCCSFEAMMKSVVVAGDPNHLTIVEEGAALLVARVEGRNILYSSKKEDRPSKTVSESLLRRESTYTSGKT